MQLLASLAMAAVLGVSSTSVAADSVPTGETLLIGKTNIFCVQAPCPWRGIARADNRQAGPSGLIWSEQNLPPLDASHGDAEQIVQAWNNDQCLSISGALVGGELRVDRIIGVCP